MCIRDRYAREMKKFQKGRKPHEDSDIARLDALLKKISDVEKAEIELAQANKLLDKPNVQAELLRRGLTPATVIGDYEQTLEPRLHPHAAEITKITEETG